MHWPPWLMMWTLAAAIFAACKWLTWRRRPPSKAPLWKRAGYLIAWPGFDIRAFFEKPTPEPSLREWAFAVAKLGLGIVLTWLAVPQMPADRPLLRGWVGMAGLIFLLHFGSFHLLSCAWRSAGVEAKPLMNWPILSTGASEFWGRRWNTAFRDLTYQFLFWPLSARLGPRAGIAAGFLASGLVHDLVISVPAGGGYGWPTLYFVLQGLGLLAERSQFGKSLGLGTGRAGRAFTAVLVIGPADALFHPPFVLRIVVPFLAAIGAT